jgi:hypothetical protein
LVLALIGLFWPKRHKPKEPYVVCRSNRLWHTVEEFCPVTLGRHGYQYRTHSFITDPIFLPNDDAITSGCKEGVVAFGCGGITDPPAPLMSNNCASTFNGVPISGIRHFTHYVGDETVLSTPDVQDMLTWTPLARALCELIASYARPVPFARITFT